MGTITFVVAGVSYSSSTTDTSCGMVLQGAASLSAASGYVPRACTAENVAPGASVFLSKSGAPIDEWQVASIDAPTLVSEFSYTEASGFFGFGLVTVLAFAVLGRQMGAILSMLR